MPRGALPWIRGALTSCRSTRTSVLGPATRGFSTVGIPAPSIVKRTTRSACWTTIQASDPFGRQAIATGFVKNSLGAGVVPRLMPWFRLSGAVRRTAGSVWAAVISARVFVLNKDTSPCAFTLNRKGPFGDAPVLTTYVKVCSGWMAMAASWFGKTPVGVVNVCGFVEATAGTWLGAGASFPFELNPVLA